MFPVYPTFRNLELADLDLLKYYVADSHLIFEYSPLELYSTLPFLPTMISTLNKNLIVKYDPAYSSTYTTFIIGYNNLVETIKELLKRESEISFFTENQLNELINNNETNTFSLREDLCDYIINSNTILTANFDSLVRLRNLSSRFKEANPTAIFTQIDNTDIKYYKEGLQILFNSWLLDHSFNKPYLFGMQKQLDFSISNLHLFSDVAIHLVISDNKCIGFSLSEMFHAEFSFGHYLITDRTYKDEIFFLIHNLMEVLDKRNVRYMNISNDLGLINLRKFKNSLMPAKLLKKHVLF